MSNMQSGISLDVFIPVVQAELRNLVKQLPAPRYLVYPDYLTFFMNQFLVSFDELKNGEVKIAPVSSIASVKSRLSVSIISISDTEYIDKVLKQISKNKHIIKSLFIIPRDTAYVEQIIKENELISITNVPKHPEEIMVQDLHADFISVENGFFLLPGRNTFQQFFIDNDYTELYSAARSIAKIQYLYGKIPEVITVGSASARLKEILNGIQAKIEQNSHSIPQIDSIFIFDRSIDPISTVVTNSPLDKLIDELFHIQYGRVFKDNPICPTLGENREVKPFIDTDPIWAEYRQKSISQAVRDVPNLIDMVKEASEQIQENNDQLKIGVSVKLILERSKRILKVTDNKIFIDQAVEYVEKLNKFIPERIPAYRAIINAEYLAFKGAESPLLVAEQLISVLGDWKAALRLLILGGIVKGPYDDKTVRVIGRELVAEFGAPAIPAMLALEKLGYVSPEPFAWKWKELNRELKLFLEESPDGGYKDPLAAPHEGFVPIAVRLAQRIATGSLGKVPEILGRNFTASGAKPARVDGEVRRVLVFFVGGVTYAEEKLVRSLGELPEFKGKYEFIVGATETINGNSLIEQVAPWINDK